MHKHDVSPVPSNSTRPGTPSATAVAANDAAGEPAADVSNRTARDKAQATAADKLREIASESLDGRELVRCPMGQVYIVDRSMGNPSALRVGSRAADALLLQAATRQGKVLKRRELVDLNEQLNALAQQVGYTAEVHVRCAPASDGGVEIDLGDAEQRRVRITPTRGVELLTKGSDTLFYRSPTSKPMLAPAAVGNIGLLDDYITNLHPTSRVLFAAWVTFTIAHPKVSGCPFPLLVLEGSQGSGKSTTSRVAQELIDPSTIGLQLLPPSVRELAIACQSGHLLAYDNMRGMSSALSDALCVASTGGALSTRQLYTDAGQHVLHLHCALLLNGIHDLIHQPDLAQRAIVLHLVPFTGPRRGQAEFFSAFQADLPAIHRGLFELIAAIFARLPEAEVVNPERMIEFSRWLAALELVKGVPTGTYQAVYSDAIQQGQRDTLLAHPLAAAVLEFAEDEIKGDWSGTPSDLLEQLNICATKETQRSPGWPLNAIALSKRLGALQAALLAQGIQLELHRGKHRTVTIRRAKP